jgi:hypothetical protein
MPHKPSAIAVVAILLVITAGCNPPKPVTTQEPVGFGGVMFSTKEDMKQRYPNAEWYAIGDKYIFCANDLPSYGRSRIEICGWIYRKQSIQWESVVNVIVHDIGKVALIHDEHNDTISVDGRANNRYMNKSVLTLQLDVLD